VHELAQTTRESIADLSQRVGTRQLAEEHRNALRPATESLGPTFGIVPLDQGREFRPWDLPKNLTE
jgi:hypothetical protein